MAAADDDPGTDQTDNRSHRDVGATSRPGETEEINGRSLGCGFILFLIRFHYFVRYIVYYLVFSSQY